MFRRTDGRLREREASVKNDNDNNIVYDSKKYVEKFDFTAHILCNFKFLFLF